MSVKDKDQSQKTLIVIIHGFRGNKKSMEDVEKLALNCYPNSKTLVNTYDHSSIYSTTKAAGIVQQILASISKEFANEPFGRLIVIGYSMGAVLARRVVIEASGLKTTWDGTDPVGNLHLKVETELSAPPVYKWAEFVDTLILMASVSRGWSVESAKSGIQKLQWNVGAIIGHLLPKQLKPTLFEFRKGSPFIVQTRLRWIQYCHSKNSKKRLKLIQFLGTLDELVPPNDSVDFASPPKRIKFLQIEIPDTDHKNVIHLTESKDAARIENLARINRGNIVGAVLKNEVDDYKKYLVTREQLHDELPPEPDIQTLNLVFVVHGIRDNGYWTKKVAGRIKISAKARDLEFASRTPSYGYFPILPFLLPWYRRQKIEWLMDNYVETAASYPKAAFHFMGHSNGTYLCARALLDYPSASFKHIMFAGSVVRSDFEWDQLVSSGKVSKILNAKATSDWVVAIFTFGLRHFQKFFDLGGAGHVGFCVKGLHSSLFQLDMSNQQIFVKGAHSAAREEKLWDDIAEFIVAGSPPKPTLPNEIFATKQTWFFKRLGDLSPILIYLGGGLILGVGFFLIFTLFIDMGLGNFLKSSLGNGTTNNAIWNNWINLGSLTHILLAGAYFYFLRFMAIRF